VRHEGSVGLAPQQLAVGRRRDQQPPIGQEVDAHRERGDLRLDLGGAVGSNRADTACAPVGNQISPSRQCGDSPNTMPSISTPMTNQTILGQEAHRRPDHAAAPDAVDGETVCWMISTSLVGQRPDSLRRRVADPVAAWLPHRKRSPCEADFDQGLDGSESRPACPIAVRQLESAAPCRRRGDIVSTAPRPRRRLARRSIGCPRALATSSPLTVAT